MKKYILTSLFLCILIQTGFAGSNKKDSKFDFTGSRDPSLIRGFDYNPPNAVPIQHHTDWWINYDSSIVDFDLDLAKSLNLNQTRVFVPYIAYKDDKQNLPIQLREFIHACQKRDIGVMIVVGSGPWVKDTTLRPEGRKWAKFLVDAISKEPGLRFWDVMNEPDWPPSPKELVDRKFENAKFMANTFHELDPNTPVTIGMAFVDGMIKLADYVDVLQFHNYLQTREEIMNDIARAKEFAAKVHKPLIDGEIGCVARANPYDIALEEHMKAKVGWYIWELMIVPKEWGPVQGVFYADGTVRDPSIPAAIMGFFRKRSGDILPSVPDREGWVTKIINQGNKWLIDTNRTWKDGLNIAEIQANLLESAQLTAMRIPPTYEVEMLRKGDINFKALKKLIIKFQNILKPYELPQKKD